LFIAQKVSFPLDGGGSEESHVLDSVNNVRGRGA
jgi:hypothetical protein